MSMAKLAGVLSVFLLAGLMSPSPIYAAGFTTGNALYAECTLDQDNPSYFAAKLSCMSYIVAAADSLESMRQMADKGQCIPDGTSKQQVTDIVIKYLRDNPEQRHFTAASTAILGMIAAFDCK